MDTPDRVMGTLERLEKMKKDGTLEKIAIKTVRSILEREKRAKEIVSNYDYINWLEVFNKQQDDSFYDDDWVYNPDDISKEDLENVNKLSDFFKGIEMYADENYYYSIPCDYGEYYVIEYNDKLYEIGCLNGQGTVFFVKVLTEGTKGMNVPNCIKFKDICENNPNPCDEKITTDLENLEKVILAMISNDIPIEAIVEKINTVIEEVSKGKKTIN